MIWDAYNDDYTEDEKVEILEQLSNQYLQPSRRKSSFSEADLIHRGLADCQKILAIFEYLLDKKWSNKRANELLELIRNKPFFDEGFEQQIKAVYTQIANLYCKGKKTDSNSYCDDYLEQCAYHADAEEVKRYCQQVLEKFKTWKKSYASDGIFFFEHIANCWVNAKLELAEIQTLVE